MRKTEIDAQQVKQRVIHTCANLFFRAEFLICFTEIYCMEGNLCLLLILFLGLLFIMDFCTLQCWRFLRACKCFCSRKTPFVTIENVKNYFFCKHTKAFKAHEPMSRRIDQAHYGIQAPIYSAWVTCGFLKVFLVHFADKNYMV